MRRYISKEMAAEYNRYSYARTHNPVEFEDGRWCVYRHADALRVMTSDEFSNDLSSLMPETEELEPFRRGNFQNMDGEAHRSLKGLVSQAFTPSFVGGLTPQISRIADELLDNFEGSSRVDVAAQFGHVLPIFVIAEVLGLPRADIDRFRRWADALLVDFGIDAIRSEDGVEKMSSNIREMNAYFAERIAVARAQPGPDFISKLVSVHKADDNRALEDVEIIGFLGLLIIAGHLTTSTLIGNTVMCMEAQSAEDRMLFLHDSTIQRTAIEETLRYRSPLIWLNRIVAENLELGGASLQRGDLVSVALASTSFDSLVFRDPLVFDMSRSPNKHLSFGRGAHFCMGAPLARLETSIAVSRFLERFPRFSLADEPVYRDVSGFQGAKSIYVTVEA